jgi:ABC-type transport system involved in cytochrome c biogenesis ATPase subunit
MLAVESLSVAYGESVVLSGIDLEVASGQVVRLMGRNGVGKTTLLRSIMGLMRPRQGKVRFLAADMTLWPSHRRARAGISYVPQGRQVFPFLTVHENLLMGLEAAPARHRSPESVEQMYDLFPALKLAPRKAAGTLSGGQQQQRPWLGHWSASPDCCSWMSLPRGFNPLSFGRLQTFFKVCGSRGRLLFCWWSSSWTSPWALRTIATLWKRAVLCSRELLKTWSRVWCGTTWQYKLGADNHSREMTL